MLSYIGVLDVSSNPANLKNSSAVVAKIAFKRFKGIGCAPWDSEGRSRFLTAVEEDVVEEEVVEEEEVEEDVVEEEEVGVV